MGSIYVDHAATTPLAHSAREAMRPWLEEDHGNPSSQHAHGRKARAALDQAREVVSEAIGCLFGEIVFTSCGTEASNLAMLGTALANKDPHRNRVLVCAAEHHCVLHATPLLRRFGYKVEQVPVDLEARVNLDALSETLADDVLFVAVMHANNELGTINPIREVARRAHEHGAQMLCDAVQTCPHFRLEDLDADMVWASAHKFNGPKGAGFLFARAGSKIRPIVVGGGQEREMRAGTENVAAIVGMAQALTLHRVNPSLLESKTITRAAFQAKAQTGLGELLVPTVGPSPTLPGHFHFRIPGISAETLLIRLDMHGVSASSGAACSSGSLEPSHVLLACGYDKDEAFEGIRFSFGLGNTEPEAEEAAERLCKAVADIRSTRKTAQLRVL